MKKLTDAEKLRRSGYRPEFMKPLIIDNGHLTFWQKIKRFVINFFND